MATKKKTQPPVARVAIASWLDGEPSYGWLHFVGAEAQHYLDAKPGRSGAPFLKAAVGYAKAAHRSVDDGFADVAAALAMGALQAAWKAEFAERGGLIDKGMKFEQGGRKKGAVGEVHKAVRACLKRTPRATAAQVWETLKAKPPKGMEFFANKLGMYIVTTAKGGGVHSTSYRRFVNLVSEVKHPK